MKICKLIIILLIMSFSISTKAEEVYREPGIYGDDMMTYFSLYRAKKLVGGRCAILFIPSYSPEYSVSFSPVHDDMDDKVDVVITSFKENVRQLLWKLLDAEDLQYYVDENEIKILHDPRFLSRFQVEERSVRVKKNKVSHLERVCNEATETLIKPNVELTLDGTIVRFSHFNARKDRFVTGRIYEEVNPKLFSVANSLKEILSFAEKGFLSSEK